jgi:tRNA (cmo5U34)-methyltransferase
MVTQADIRETQLEREHYDVVVAAAVLHHLRGRDEWHQVLESIHASLRPGGSFWIWDLIRHENQAIEAVQRERYREYLTGLKNADYAQDVFDYIEREDTPESVSFIVAAMVRAGFTTVDVVHKNSMFAAISGVR